MDVLAIILACSLHHDDALVRALVDVQSGGNAYFVGDLATLKTNDLLASPEAALRFAEDLQRQGGKPAVGLLGIPLEWAGRYGREPIELFDGCINVAVATAAFQDYEARCVQPYPPRSLGKRPVNAPRRMWRHRGPATVRSCLLLRFAHDLGLRVALAGVPSRLAPNATVTSRKDNDSGPQSSLVSVDGTEGDRSERASRSRPNIFLDVPAASSDAR